MFFMRSKEEHFKKIVSLSHIKPVVVWIRLGEDWLICDE